MQTSEFSSSQMEISDGFAKIVDTAHCADRLEGLARKLILLEQRIAPSTQDR